MATYQLRSFRIEKFTKYIFEKGSETVKSSATLVSRLTVTQKIVATVTLVTSIWLFSLSNLWNGTEVSSKQPTSNSDQGTLTKVRRLKVIRFSAWVTGGFLKVIENAISPKGEAKVDSEQQLPDNSSNEGDLTQSALRSDRSTQMISDDSTRPSCASLVEDLAQTTSVSPVKSVRSQLASKLRGWRVALQDECDGRAGYYELQKQNEDGQARKTSWLLRAWRAIFNGHRAENGPDSVQEMRKRKRPEGDDYLALYVPLNKGVHRLDETDSRHIFSDTAVEDAGIRGLSIVPIIGNWYSAEKLNEDNGRNEAATEHLDHISLVQRDLTAPPIKQNAEDASDAEQYEILEMEMKMKISTPSSVEVTH